MSLEFLSSPLLDKLSAKISHFGNNVFLNQQKHTKRHQKPSPAGMVYGLK